MVKLLTTLAAAGLAAAGLAMAGPVTAHAQIPYTGCGPGGCGPCFTPSPGHPVQSEDFGFGNKHSFTNSHNNCVEFDGNNNTAFLNDSDGNAVIMLGNNNKVDDFNHSNTNFVFFDVGSSGNELQGSHANNNTVDFTPTAVGDFVNLLGTTNDNITIAGPGVFANVFDFGGGDTCTITATAPGSSAKHPQFVLC